MNDPQNWSDDEIRYYFDHNLNIRVSDLARITRKTIHDLKRILMDEEER